MKCVTLICLIYTGAIVCAAPDAVRRKTHSNLSKLGIYDGKVTTIEKHPYVASMLQNGDISCAATIISDTWVVTLADCVDGLNMTEFSIVVGSDNAHTGVSSYSIKQYIVHPSYDGFSDYNVAVVQIDGKLSWSKKVKAAKLPSKKVHDNSWLTVAGYGIPSLIQESDANDLQIRQGKMQWLPSKNCSAIFKPLGFTWTSRMACAVNTGKTTMCLGDFGDALVKNNVFYGIYEMSTPEGFCTEDALPGIFTDVLSVADWIKKEIGV